MGELKRILLADDHQIVLDGLRSLLSAEFAVCDAVRDGRQLVEKAMALRPDVIVADVSMPLLNGIDAVKQLREAGVAAKVVFLTMHPDMTYLSRALEAGGSAYVLKHAAADELVTAIQLALRGERFLSPQLRTAAVEEFLSQTGRRGKEAMELTQRQREVLQLLAEGKSAKEIGGLLGISSRTVETHKYAMMDQLGVKTTAGLVQQAIKLGLA